MKLIFSLSHHMLGNPTTIVPPSNFKPCLHEQNEANVLALPELLLATWHDEAKRKPSLPSIDQNCLRRQEVRCFPVIGMLLKSNCIMKKQSIACLSRNF